MENLKIRVSSEVESKEAQELFFELGCEWPVISSRQIIDKVLPWIICRDGKLSHCSNSYQLEHLPNLKEITLPELRALVSLHKNPINMDKVLSEVRFDALGLLKDKEYLRRNAGGTYSYVGTVHPDHVHDLLIEIPEGKNIAWLSDTGSIHFSTIEMGYRDCKIVWQRHTHPEELPFVDDEPYKPGCDEDSLPDFLFEDTVNHPSHYASGEIECIDAMEAMLTPEQFIGYLRGNAFKYQWRYENKGGITDLEKAQWYLNKLISRIG